MSDRRGFVRVSTYVLLGVGLSRSGHLSGSIDMYGLVGRIIATEGNRDELANILIEGVGGMPGCLSYVVARDAEDPNALWVTEVWDSEESHRRSLSLQSVQDAIRKGRPLIAGFDERHETVPIGGHGLAP